MLDELVREAIAARRNALQFLYEDVSTLFDALGDAEQEVENWKERAEAFERATKDICCYCVHSPSPLHNESCNEFWKQCKKSGESHWEFDEERFM